MAALLAACGGAGNYAKPIDQANRTIYFERIEPDGYGLNNQIELALIKVGFQPVSDPARAGYRLRLAMDWNPYNMTALVRVTESATGDSVYLGEGKNKGWGTMVNPSGAMSGCLERAMENLK